MILNSQKVVLSLFLITLGCNSHNAEKNIPEKHGYVDTDKFETKKNKDILPIKDKKDAVIVYEYNNDTLIQKLAIKYISKQEINFVLTCLNKIKNKTTTLTGLAKAIVVIQDPEIDDDDQGNAYNVIEYHYTKNECSLSIRIAMDAKDKVQIMEYSCAKLHESNCPFGSVRLLKKVTNSSMP